MLNHEARKYSNSGNETNDATEDNHQQAHNRKLSQLTATSSSSGSSSSLPNNNNHFSSSSKINQNHHPTTTLTSSSGSSSKKKHGLSVVAAAAPTSQGGSSSAASSSLMNVYSVMDDEEEEVYSLQDAVGRPHDDTTMNHHRVNHRELLDSPPLNQQQPNQHHRKSNSQERNYISSTPSSRNDNNNEIHMDEFHTTKSSSLTIGEREDDKSRSHHQHGISPPLPVTLQSSYFTNTDHHTSAQSTTTQTSRRLSTIGSNVNDIPTAGPPTSPTMLRVYEQEDEKFNYHAINAMRQLYVEGAKEKKSFFKSGMEDEELSGGILMTASRSGQECHTHSAWIDPSEYVHNFHKLSKDEIGIIVSFMPMHDNLNFGLTSKEYYYLSIQDRFWKCYIMKLSTRERKEMQTVFYQLDIDNSEYNYNFSDADNIYTPLNSFKKKGSRQNSKSNGPRRGFFGIFWKSNNTSNNNTAIRDDDSLNEAGDSLTIEDDLAFSEEDLHSIQIGSINDNVTKMIHSRRSSSSSNKSYASGVFSKKSVESYGSTSQKRLPLKHQYILYKQHSKTVRKKERGKRAEDRIDELLSKRCQPCLYFQLCMLSFVTLVFITLSLVFGGLYFDGSVEKEQADTLIVVSPVGFSFIWLPIFFVFILSTYLFLGWIPYVSNCCLALYRKHQIKASDESKSLLRPNEDTDSDAETSIALVILRRLFFSPEMQNNVNEPNYQLLLCLPSQFIWFSVLIFCVALHLVAFNGQTTWRFFFIPVYIFIFIAAMDFTYRLLRVWKLTVPSKRTWGKLLTIIYLAINMWMIYLSGTSSLFLSSLKMDNLPFMKMVEWSVVLSPSFLCLLLLHTNICLIPFYTTRIFYNGFQSQTRTILAILSPFPLTVIVLSPFTCSLILLALRLDSFVTFRYVLVLAPLYCGLSIYMIIIGIYSIVKIFKSFCCK
ncbi:hypothetical protein C9374_012070 [Naegleria lovaniensis]|uniref:F-box domain-containing protein n=1 Tax=Naegleria lovaniensis TaxID=51637 RepID=A0AA88GDP2_NAELO|nr:uncharacterized protein C9374_012070 [Naegleria lovaniensis]KAG2373463.1 hypothetical protein C9374_012070 [Naegleria lovaniensis]